jgi:rhodanese-related sulfurtransferase
VTAEVTAAEAVVDEEGWLLDVREQHEWDAGHAPEAHHIPMSQLSERQDELPDGRILVVCLAGGRSLRVTAALEDAGYTAINISGGMIAWQAAGGAVVTDDGTAGAVLGH